ncbi:hypothetical protein BKA65DRAFT_468525 [Rhexocercosporidium sp. MPI-PUGE-AT-0058]|nr:hypothetical protein BKA65DRAFT_468525 [Rhexocercosporidium sp. MPI-PUGE-AT-0058]
MDTPQAVETVVSLPFLAESRLRREVESVSIELPGPEDEAAENDAEEKDCISSHGGDSHEIESTAHFGIIPQAKEISLGSNWRETYDKIRSKENAPYAIIACYEKLPSATKAETSETSEKTDIQMDIYPFAISINSSQIATLLGETLNTVVPPVPYVMIRPFKLLSRFEREIKSMPDRLEGNPEAKQDITTESIPEINVAKVTDPDSTAGKDHDKAYKQLDAWQCLVMFMESHLNPLFQLRERIAHGLLEKISFENLWHLFSTGETVIQRLKPSMHERQQAYKVLYTQGGRVPLDWNRKFDFLDVRPRPTTCEPKSFRIHCFSIHYNGSWFRPREKVFEIKPFQGEKAVSELDVVPIQDSQIEKYLTRGRRFLEFSYGPAIYDSVGEKPALERGEHDVFVDFGAGYENNPLLIQDVQDVQEPQHNSEETFLPRCFRSACSRCSSVVFNDKSIDIKSFKDLTRYGVLDVINETENLTDLILPLLPSDLLAFSLRSKKWHTVDIIDIHKARRDTWAIAFDDLVLPQGHKEILRAVINNHPTPRGGRKGYLSKPEERMDFIRGRGGGLVIFLYGPPGVGKSSVVEAVAGCANPLRAFYPITCGDLDSKPDTFEKQLKAHLSAVQRWGCIALLNDAEVYLSERGDNVDKNRIVSIFLNALDDFSGILCLTSNREGLIDEALKSRIHIALRFQNLDRNATLSIWETNMRCVREQSKRLRLSSSILDWAMNHYDKMSEQGTPWNGRQIRNAFQIAIALASQESRGTSRSDDDYRDGSRNVKLSSRHFKMVDTMFGSFEGYLQECRGKDGERAAEFNIRLDNYDIEKLSTKHPSARVKPRRMKKKLPSDEDSDPSDSEPEITRKKKKKKRPVELSDSEEDSEEEEDDD